MAVMTQRDLT